jgi:hypothetical protein
MDSSSAALGYAHGGLAGRPTILTALAAVSIMVGLAGMAAHGWALYAAGPESAEWEETTTPSTTWDPPASLLSSQQIAAVLQEVQSLDPGAASATQTKALADYLGSQTQSLFYPESPRTISRQIHMTGSRGTVIELHTLRGRIAVAFNGVTYVTLEKQAYHVQRKTTINPTAASLAAYAGASLALDVLLLCAALAVFRGGLRGRTLHRWYAALKIPLAIGVTLVCLSIGLDKDFWFGPVIGASLAFAVGAFELAYPVALLKIMGRGRIVEYYASMAAPRC